MEYTRLGEMFIAIAILFAFGLIPDLAHWFYPESPSFRRRLAAPVLFVLLAAACFAHLGLQTFVLVALVGVALIGISRWQHRNTIAR